MNMIDMTMCTRSLSLFHCLSFPHPVYRQFFLHLNVLIFFIIVVKLFPYSYRSQSLSQSIHISVYLITSAFVCRQSHVPLALLSEPKRFPKKAIFICALFSVFIYEICRFIHHNAHSPIFPENNDKKNSYNENFAIPKNGFVEPHIQNPCIVRDRIQLFRHVFTIEYTVKQFIKLEKCVHQIVVAKPPSSEQKKTWSKKKHTQNREKNRNRNGEGTKKKSLHAQPKIN